MYIISELVWIDVLFITVGVVANAIVITFIVYFIAKLYKLRKIQMNLMKRTCPEEPSEVFRKLEQSKSIMEESK
uniref:DUF3149 domain-containing protein n=1 Tax=Caenorhabditis tropicalis TaxID=1561998 RepID=A0A1I7U9Q9_9PELO